ncbi:DMT family transporter [Paenibacillus sedimenti]|uniref:DMT family transporter n=1 Tax=Paenibacillus sedimenti TaxID=2770274 RepID=A0A926KUV0_9BACL|nr:DMT family transporter [Paenibacillus sedimenti]MBD0382559.1 DMT family transporter [Paenibacillus sedimenti]
MNRYLFGILVVVTTSLMGSSFAVGKMGLTYYSPLLLAGLRFTLAGVIMAIVVRKRPRPAAYRDWGKILAVGAFQTAGVMGCIFLSLRTITAGESSILTFTNPLFVIVLGTLFLGAKYRLSQWLGVILGCVGVFITLGVHLQLQTGTLLGIGSAISWAIATLLIKKWGAGLDVWVLTAYQMLFGGLLLLVLGFTMETPKLSLGASALLILLWLAIMASIVQFASWFYLLKQGDPGKTSAFLFLAPFFGVLSGWLLLGEVVKWYVYAGGSLILVGIFLVNWTYSTFTRKEANAA